MTGAQLITDERREQILRHKRTVKYDVEANQANELLLAAARLIYSVARISILPKWPDHWDPKICAKMDEKTDFEKIVIAGAFLAADLDRRMAMGCAPGKPYDEFTQAARPLMEYLATHHHPHCTAIVENNCAQLLEGVKGTGIITDYLKD